LIFGQFIDPKQQCSLGDDMNLLTIAFLALIVALAIQIAVVRVFRPRNHALVITLCFGLASVAAMTVFFVFVHPCTDAVERSVQTARLGLLLLSITLAHIATYSAIEDDSPSMAMVKMAWDAGHHGCSEKDFSQVMGDDLFLAKRIDAMRRDGWIECRKDQISLTPLGVIWGTLFAKVQRLLRMDEGG
jgi:hypothetical protein